MNATACTRHKGGPVVKYRTFANSARTRFAIGEARDCVRCGSAMDFRLARNSWGSTPREALAAYGCTSEEIEAYMRTHFPEEAVRDTLEKRIADASGPIEAPLTCWPFPVSAHLETA